MSALPNTNSYDLDKYLDIKSVSSYEIRKRRRERKEAHQQAMWLRGGVLLISLITVLSVIYINMQAKINGLNKEIASITNKIEIQESERTRLEMELAAKFDTRAIEEYAQEHGMRKVESYQIHYIDLSEGDKVLVSGNKSITDNFFSFFKRIFKGG